MFKPKVAVQTRELNNLQAQVQNQIEKFGDNIFKAGTIVAGCNFSFYPNYCYVKLADNNTLGVPIEVSSYVGMFARNSANLQAYIMNSQDGFEATDPNLKTIFVSYINSGNSGTANAFSSGDTLTIINGRDSIFTIQVNNGGSGFSNTDLLVISPSIEVNVASGSFSNGDYINDPVFGSNAQIVGIHTLDNSNNLIFDILPRATDLANGSANSQAWTFGAFDTIYNSGNTASGQVYKIHGSGAQGKLVTDTLGKISTMFLTSQGQDYDFLPQVTVQSKNNPTGIGLVNATPINYYDKIKVASVVAPTGNGYAFGVSNGVIYQSGHFVEVDSQTVVVNAYSSSPNNVTAGFYTQESIINYTIDPSLVDNAQGYENATAPGADRLKLVPVLVISNTDVASANADFFSLVYWNDGNPYRQNQVSVYSKIGDEMATRTADTSGNFVLDPFLVTTASVANGTQEGTTFTTVVDPGTAYIDGYKIATNRNFKIDVQKATDTTISTSRHISLNYDNYIRINNVGGLFQFSTGDLVYFYDTPKNFLANSSFVSSGNTTPQGTQIGSARIRSMVLENGIAGVNSAIYRLFLFNINMNTGANFRNIKSVYYNGTNKGIGDVVLQLDPTTQTNIAVLQNPNNNVLIFSSGSESIRNTNNTTYTYRTIDQTTSVSNTGILTKSIASNPNEFYPYSSTLSSADMTTLYVVPLANSLVASNSLTGTASCNNTSGVIVGSGTTLITDLAAGDYITIGNSSVTNIKRVLSVANNISATLDSNCSFTGSGLSLWRTFPQNAPIPFGSRSGLSANLNVNQNILTLNFGMSFTGTTSVNTAIGVNIQRTGVTSTSKTANRVQYVLLNLSNNAGGTSGPWCLGVPDAFRLRNVYLGNSSVNTSSASLSSEFYIEPGHKPNYLGLSYLYLLPKSPVSLSSASYLLVEFDYFTRSDDGYFDTVSYLGTANAALIANTDSQPLANLSSHAASWEVPEFWTSTGNYYDCLNCLDFRPAVSNTVAPSALYSSAPVNPPATISFGTTSDPANDKKFPVPDSSCQTDIEEYCGRTDVVVIGPDGNIIEQQGQPSVDPAQRFAPATPADNLVLNRIAIPPYPNITVNPSQDVLNVLATRVQSLSGNTGTRASNHLVYPIVSNTQTSVPSQPTGYTMAQIGALERRIADLEYTTSLSILETSITNTVIPSSIDGTLNRFKFGFTADDFSTTIYSNINDPSYSAEIEVIDTTQIVGNTLPKLASNLCVPPKFRWPLRFNVPALNMPYIDFTIVSQMNATSPAISNCVPATISITNTTPSQNSLFFMQSNWSSTLKKTVGTVTSGTAFVRAGTASGNCTMYYHFPYDPFIEVYQSTVDPTAFMTPGGLFTDTGQPVTTNGFPTPTLRITSASATALSANDKNYLLSNPETAQFWKTAASAGNPNYKNALAQGFNTTFGSFNKAANGWVYGSGRIDWQHNPALGRYYLFKTVLAGETASMGKNKNIIPGVHELYEMVVYPINTTTVSTYVAPCGNNAGPVSYSGLMSAGVSISDSASGATNSLVSNFSGIGLSTSNPQVFINITATGLMPKTAHILSVDGFIFPDNSVAPAGCGFGTSSNAAFIYTDESGRISLTAVDNRFITTSGSVDTSSLFNYYSTSRTFSLDAPSSFASFTVSSITISGDAALSYDLATGSTFSGGTLTL